MSNILQGIPSSLKIREELEFWDDFTCLTSLRDVEPSVGLIFNDGGLDDDPAFVPMVCEDAEADQDSDEEES
jgi:hypothetical protein